jgi:hypothetical protein
MEGDKPRPYSINNMMNAGCKSALGIFLWSGLNG